MVVAMLVEAGAADAQESEKQKNEKGREKVLMCFSFAFGRRLLVCDKFKLKRGTA